MLTRQYQILPSFETINTLFLIWLFPKPAPKLRLCLSTITSHGPSPQCVLQQECWLSSSDSSPVWQENCRCGTNCVTSPPSRQSRGRSHSAGCLPTVGFYSLIFLTKSYPNIYRFSWMLPVLSWTFWALDVGILQGSSQHEWQKCKCSFDSSLKRIESFII